MHLTQNSFVLFFCLYVFFISFFIFYSFIYVFVYLFSAGVGRTGTFMVIDSTLDRIKAENTIDIFNYVAYLRTRRTAMVQTEVRTLLIAKTPLSWILQ